MFSFCLRSCRCNKDTCTSTNAAKCANTWRICSLGSSRVLAHLLHAAFSAPGTNRADAVTQAFLICLFVSNERSGNRVGCRICIKADSARRSPRAALFGGRKRYGAFDAVWLSATISVHKSFYEFALECEIVWVVSLPTVEGLPC